MTINTEILIIGGGPAGIACAMQLARQGIEAVVFEKRQLGGLLNNANYVENYLGFPQGISGPSLVRLMTEQINKQNIKLVYEAIHSLGFYENMFHAKSQKTEIASPYVVIASGTKPKLPGIFIPDETQKNIFFEVYPVLNIQSKTIGIIGAGDAAFDYALNLSKKNEVYIFNRSQKTKALPLLIERCNRSKTIHYKSEHQIKKISALNNQIQNVFKTKDQELIYSMDKLIFATGREPDLDFLSQEVHKNLNRLMSDKSLFLIGDVVNGQKRQVSIATGNGIQCAMELNDLISKR